MDQSHPSHSPRPLNTSPAGSSRFPSVLLVQEHLPAYRVPFFAQLRARLETQGVALRLLHAPRIGQHLIQGTLPWAEPVPIHWLGPLGWQNILPQALGTDLIIAPQEVKYAALPCLMATRRLGRWKFAFWGHGKNFQSPNPRSLAERWKRFLSVRADWWFAYNELSARIVRQMGFPAERITTVMNSIDTRSLLEAPRQVPAGEVARLQSELGLRGKTIVLYEGGLYREKRILFLLEACRRIRREIPDLELLVIGRGPEADLLAGSREPWIHLLGPQSGVAKVPYWMMSRLLLMPGGVGLVIQDSLALGVPMLTTACPYHGPEIDYVRHGKNAWVVEDWENPQSYAEAAIRLLRDDALRDQLVQAGRQDASLFSIEEMSRLFAEGIFRCLQTPRRT